MSIHSVSRNFRYYPTDKEINYLVSFIKEYFSYPERSPERNQIASSISDHLKRKNPHWTHRAVRLWLNNNKKRYLESGYPENNILESKSSSFAPKKHILSNLLLSIPSSNSLDLSEPSRSESYVFFDGYDILFDNARVFSSSNLFSDQIDDDINRIFKKCSINPIQYLPKTVPHFSFPPFIKHKLDINNILNFPNSNFPAFWKTSTFVSSSSFQSQNTFIPPNIIPKPGSCSKQSQTQSLQQYNELKIEPIYFLSPSYSIFINNHQISYKPTFTSSKPDMNSENDWLSCLLPELIEPPITGVYPLNAHQFFITNSSHVFLIEIHLSLSEKESVAHVLKQGLLSDIPGQASSSEICLKSKNIFMEMVDDKLLIAKNPNQTFFFDQNLENNQRLSFHNSKSSSMNSLLGDNEFYQYFSAFKTIRHENIPKYLIGYENNVIFRMYDQNGQLNRNFIGHSHPILELLQLTDQILASAQDSCLFLWDYRDQTPILAVDFNPLSITSNINFIIPSMFDNQAFQSGQKHDSMNFNNILNPNNESVLSTKNINNNDHSIEQADQASNMDNDEERNNNGCNGIGMALSDGRMRFIDFREPRPIKGFSNVVGVINKFVSSFENKKMAFFCSMPISYWDCDYS